MVFMKIKSFLWFSTVMKPPGVLICSHPQGQSSVLECFSTSQLHFFGVMQESVSLD